MSRFSPNWDDVQPGLGNLPAGDYVFIVDTPKIFDRPKKDAQGNETGERSQGLGFLLRTEDGQKAYHNLYMTENTVGMVLGFMMCLYGFNPNDGGSVAEFKAQHGRNMWVDFDTSEIGSTFLNVSGQRIRAVNTPRTFNGQEQNNFKFRPF